MLEQEYLLYNLKPGFIKIPDVCSFNSYFVYKLLIFNKPSFNILFILSCYPTPRDHLRPCRLYSILILQKPTSEPLLRWCLSLLCFFQGTNHTINHWFCCPKASKVYIIHIFEDSKLLIL